METERASALLLVAMYKRNPSDPMEHLAVEELPGWGELGVPRLRMVTAHLRQAGLIRPLGGSHQGVWQITPAGVVHAERLLRDRDRPIVRYDMAVNGLVTAGADAFPEHRLELADFLLSGHVQVLDTVLTREEVTRAVVFLEEEGLVTVERLDGEPTAITLTPQGRLCGWTDRTDVRGYLAGRQPSGIQQNWNVTVHGGAPQIGQGNVQHNDAQDPLRVAEFARELRGMASTGAISAPADVRREIAEDARELERAARQGSPVTASRVRDLLERLRRNLESSDTPMALLALERLL
ncbi:hypothetical protein AB0M38_16140 [Streptomyces sp. NPDC051742]|uniref:hypothetical protein n=1 Tax=unclassified Streptomyces TaxID=2593676 RepID=UPI0034417CF6